MKVLVYQASQQAGHYIQSQPITCAGYGHAACIKNKEHSWFNHAMDSYYEHPGISNLPEGFIEP